MQLDWFHSFLETCKYKSLTKASEQLNMTQPALSKLIRNLEKELGVTLFSRTVTGVELTEAGIQLKERIEPILDEIHVLVDDLRTANKNNKLKIAVLPSIATYYLPERMSIINQSFPGVQLVVANTSDEVIQLLASGDVQLVIAENGKLPMRHLWQSILFEEPYYCIVPETSRFSTDRPIYISELLEEPLIVYPSNCDIRAAIVRNYLEKGGQPKVSLEIPFSESILAFVNTGTGITIAPQMIANQSHRYGLKSVRVYDFDEPRRVAVMARSEALGKLLYKVLVQS